MNVGDRVLVENVNGETTVGEIVEVTDDMADDRLLYTSRYGPDVFLGDYWSPEDVGDDRVIVVQLGPREYDYPESKVEVIEE